MIKIVNDDNNLGIEYYLIRNIKGSFFPVVRTSCFLHDLMCRSHIVDDDFFFIHGTVEQTNPRTTRTHPSRGGNDTREALVRRDLLLSCHTIYTEYATVFPAKKKRICHRSYLGLVPDPTIPEQKMSNSRGHLWFA
jgi:hypothetical protein